MRSLGRPALAAALTLVLGLGVAALPAYAEDTPVPSSSAPAADDPPAREDAPAPTPQDTEPTPTPTPDRTQPASGPDETDPTPGPDETDPTPGPDETEAPPIDDPDILTLDNAQFRWSLNTLFHMRPHFGSNFLTAGPLPYTAGGVVKAAQWKQKAGSVSIQRADGAKYVPATWTGFGTGVDHQVVIDGGKGTVNASAGTARIAWTGSFGVARYSGMTGFTISNPVLIVENGAGRIEATASAYPVERDGNGSGGASDKAVTKVITLADFGRVDLSKTGPRITPNYAGIQVSHPDQRRDGNGNWGSFPASFIDFVDVIGQAPFWMSSGSDDEFKAPSDVFVSFNAKEPIKVTPPPVGTGTKKPRVDNRTNKAPAPVKAPMQAVSSAPTAFPPINVAPATVAPVEPVSFNTAAVSSLTGLPTVLVAADDRSELGWWLASTFLLMAAIAVSLPSFIARSRAS